MPLKFSQTKNCKAPILKDFYLSHRWFYTLIMTQLIPYDNLKLQRHSNDISLLQFIYFYFSSFPKMRNYARSFRKLLNGVEAKKKYGVNREKSSPKSTGLFL